MKTGIENENGFQNETQTSFQNENEPVIWIENETELQNEIEMKNRFQNETENENENQFENENENELQNGFQNELEHQSQNELAKVRAMLQDYNERFNRENCIELLWEHFRELHNLKPIITKAGLKADIKKYNDGFKTIQYYETDYNKFRVERVWQTEPTKKMIDLRITKIKGE